MSWVLAGVLAATSLAIMVGRRHLSAPTGSGVVAAGLIALSASEAVTALTRELSAVPLRTESVRLPSTLFAIVGCFLIGRGLAQATAGWDSSYAKGRAAVDLAALYGLTTYVAWAPLLGPLAKAAPGHLDALVLARPLAYNALAAGTVVLMPRTPADRRLRSILRGAGVIVIALALAARTAALDLDVSGWGPLVVLVAAFGAIIAGTSASPRRMLDRPVPPTLRWGLILAPFIALFIALVVISVNQVRQQEPSQTFYWTGLAVAVLLAFRQLLSLLENTTLTEELEATVSELRARELDLEHLAYHDPLTNLANRTLFSNRVAHAIERTKRSPIRLWVLFIDVDDFKQVNDRLGHAAGDSLLQSFADLLRELFRPSDTVARLGGDEFAVLLEESADSESPIGPIAAQRILDRLERPLRVLYQDLHAHVSVGLAGTGAGVDLPRLPAEPSEAVSPVLDVESLLRRADVAMHAAKDQGKQRAVLFEPTMHSLVLERLDLVADLERDISVGRLSLVYQPIVSLDTGQVTSVEALLRWNHATRGQLGPNIFIPLAEQANLMVPLGRFVMFESCRQAARWQFEQPGLSVAVNLSASQLQDPALLTDVTSALQSADLPPHCLTLEVTESVIMGHTDVNLDTLEALESLGITLAIDDFGTGYSSLSYLQRFPIHKVKVDKTFVDEVGQAGSQTEANWWVIDESVFAPPLTGSASDASMRPPSATVTTTPVGGADSSGAPATRSPFLPEVRGVPRRTGDGVILAGIIGLAKALDLVVVAEGVERPDQLSRLYELDCDEAQGYLFSAPLEARDFVKWLRRHHNRPLIDNPALIE